MAGPVAASTRVSAPIAISSTPDSTPPSGTRWLPPGRNGTRRACSRVAARVPNRSQPSDSTTSGATIPTTYAALTDSAARNEPDAPARTVTPTRTGAQHADAIPEKTPNPYTAPKPPPAVLRPPGMGSFGDQPASTATPPTAISSPPTVNNGVCHRWNAAANADAPSPIGTITVATPAANTTVPATTPAGRRNTVARYAGSITDTQHGASSATTPANAEVSSALLGIAGAALTVILAAQTLQQLPLAAVVIGAAAAIADAVAIGILAWSLLPRLSGGGWLAYADLHPWHARMHAEHPSRDEDDAAQLVLLARIARGKYRAIRAAVYVLLGVVGLVLVAAAVAISPPLPTSTSTVPAAAVVALVAIGVYVAFSGIHGVGDYIAQTRRQATGKGAPAVADLAAGAHPWRGWGWCLRHVASYTTCQAIALAAFRAVGLPVTLTGAVVALLISGGTHLVVDRRWFVAAVMGLLGKTTAEWPDGPRLIDQALHKAAMLLAALAAAAATINGTVMLVLAMMGIAGLVAVALTHERRRSNRALHRETNLVEAGTGAN